MTCIVWPTLCKFRAWRGKSSNFVWRLQQFVLKMLMTFEMTKKMNWAIIHVGRGNVSTWDELSSLSQPWCSISDSIHNRVVRMEYRRRNLIARWMYQATDCFGVCHYMILTSHRYAFDGFLYGWWYLKDLQIYMYVASYNVSSSYNDFIHPNDRCVTLNETFLERVRLFSRLSID